MATIKIHVTKEDEEGSTSSTQKVTMPVDPDAWYKLKVYCAEHKIKMTWKAGEIIKEWVDTNISV